MSDNKEHNVSPLQDISQQEEEKVCTVLGYCPNVYCYSCVVNHLHLNFEETLADPNWRCPPCREQCCCCRTECTLNHRHCFTYTRTKKRYEKARQWKMHQQLNSSMPDGRGGPAPMSESHVPPVPMPTSGQVTGPSFNSPLLKRPRACDQHPGADDLMNVASPNKKPRYEHILPPPRAPVHVPRRRGALPGIGSYGLLPEQPPYVSDPRYKNWDTPSPDLLNLMRSASEMSRYGYIAPKPEGQQPEFPILAHTVNGPGDNRDMYSPILPDVTGDPRMHEFQSPADVHVMSMHPPRGVRGMHPSAQQHGHVGPQGRQGHPQHSPHPQAHQHQPPQSQMPPQQGSEGHQGSGNLDIVVSAPSGQNMGEKIGGRKGMVEATVVERKQHFNSMFKEEPEGEMEKNSAYGQYTNENTTGSGQ